MKVLVSTGIRSEYDILFPVILELTDQGHEVKLVVSGAHLSNHHDNTYTRIMSDGFEIADRIDTLLPTDRSVQRSKATGFLITAMSQTVERVDPDFLLVIGDREESISTALVGNYMEKIIVHIGGGDPVYGNADDPVRFAVSKLANVHCCFAREYADNLINIGEEQFRIFVTGNPSYRNIEVVPVMEKEELMDQLGVTSDDFIVLIKHPLSSEVKKAGEQMQITLDALEIFCTRHNYQVVCIPPNSDPGSYEINQMIRSYSGHNWFIRAETLPRQQFVNLMRNACALIGNSSMGLLEAPFYNLPVVNIGNRQLGRLNAGNVEFVQYQPETIVQAVEKAAMDREYRNRIRQLTNPFGDASAPRKIREAMESVDLKDRKWYIKKDLC